MKRLVNPAAVFLLVFLAMTGCSEDRVTYNGDTIIPQANPPLFYGGLSLHAGDNPQSVSCNDFNGDGNRDLAVSNVMSSDASILAGNGDGTFSHPGNYTVGGNPDL